MTCIKLLSAFIVLAQLVAGRTSQKTLLDVTDRLYVYEAKEGKDSFIDQYELRQFPYVMAVSATHESLTDPLSVTV